MPVWNTHRSQSHFKIFKHFFAFPVWIHYPSQIFLSFRKTFTNILCNTLVCLCERTAIIGCPECGFPFLFSGLFHSAVKLQPSNFRGRRPRTVGDRKKEKGVIERSSPNHNLSSPTHPFFSHLTHFVLRQDFALYPAQHGMLISRKLL